MLYCLSFSKVFTRYRYNNGSRERRAKSTISFCYSIIPGVFALKTTFKEIIYIYILLFRIIFIINTIISNNTFGIYIQIIYIYIAGYVYTYISIQDGSLF